MNTRLPRRAGLVALVWAMSGCASPSLLLTPVTSRRTLVETEMVRESLFASDKIALIDVSGTLVNEHRLGLLSRGEHPVSLLLEELDRARRDRHVKAVLLRINSPGGTVVATELMYEEIQHFRRSGKPIIAVMMDVAASGGYYIACACDEILAQQSTITGSIGVIMRLIDVSGTMGILGVKSDAIMSGTHKDLGSPYREMKPEERELFQGIVEDMYERFVRAVMEGRPKLDEAAVRRLADGRVYTASQALASGLIDGFATMREAVNIAKKRAGSSRIRLITYHRPLDYRPNFYAQGSPPSSPMAGFGGFDPTSWLDSATPRFLYMWAPSWH